MLLRSVAVGMFAAVAIGALAFALAPFFDAVGVYILPAGLLLPFIGRVIPSKTGYWLTPDGGPAVGVLFIFVCTLLFWTIVFGGTYFVSATLLRRRATGQ
jgi:hypothetical protein